MLKGIYGVWLEAVKPSHRHGSQTRWKHFAHESLVFGMDGHPLVELAYVLYGVRLAIIYGKSGLVEPPRKFSPLYIACEG